MKKLCTQSFIAILFLTFLGCSSDDDAEKTPIVEIPPTKTVMKINKVTVTEMPFTDSSGADWDTGNGPDVIFSIRDAADISYLTTSSSPFNNVTSSQLPLEWTGMSPVSVSTSKIIFVELLESDGGPVNALIGAVYFTVSDYTTGSAPYPATITKTRTTLGRDTTIKLNVTWE